MTEDIIRYIDREMTPEEKGAFEVRLSQDAGLRAELKNARAAKKVSEDFIVAETLETIEKIRREEAPAVKKWSPWMRWLFLIIFMVFLGLVYWLMTKDKVEGTQQEDTMILAGVYEEPIWPLERSDNDTLSMAVRLHLADRTDEGLELLLVGDQQNDINKYWAAEIMVHAGRYRDALLLLNELADTKMEPKRVKLLRDVCTANIDM